jgi:hypothetical protein
MKPFSEENQLGLASLLNYAAIQSGKTKTPLRREWAWMQVYRTKLSRRGVEKCFFLTSSFIG